MEKLAYETRYSVSNTTIFLSYSFSIKQLTCPPDVKTYRFSLHRRYLYLFLESVSTQ
jgi:hypothetical protein